MNPDEQPLFNTGDASIEVNPYPLCIAAFVLTLLSAAYWVYHLPSLTGQSMASGLFEGLSIFSLAAAYSFMLFKRYTLRAQVLTGSLLAFLAFFAVERSCFVAINFSSLYFLYIFTTCLTIASLIALFILLSLKSAGKNIPSGVIRLMSVLLIVSPLPYAMSNILREFSSCIMLFSLDHLFALLNELMLCFIQIVLFIFVLFSMDQSFFDQYIRVHPKVLEEDSPAEKTQRLPKKPERSIKRWFRLSKAAFIVVLLTCAIEGYIIYQLISNGNSFSLYLIQVLGFLFLVLFFAFILFSKKKFRMWAITLSFFAYAVFKLIWDGLNLSDYGLDSLSSITAIIEFFLLTAFCLLLAARAAKINFPPLVTKILALVLIALSIPDFVIITKQFIDFTIYYYTSMNSGNMIQVGAYILQQVFIFFVLATAYLTLYKSATPGFYEGFILTRPERVKHRARKTDRNPDPFDASASGAKDETPAREGINSKNTEDSVNSGEPGE